MTIAIIAAIGAGISALIGAGVSTTDFGQKMESALENAVDCIKQVIGRD